ncbi:MAG: 50S ribosomal protein L23 [Patescibacteria group bacterium]
MNKSDDKKQKREIKETIVVSGKSALIIKQPWITEKAGDLVNLRKYNFLVDKNANKPEIKKAIELLYKTKVDSVNIICAKGKLKRLGKNVGKTSDYKKAIVTLKEGQKIDIMPA